MLKHFVSRPFLQLAIIAAICFKNIVRETLATRKQSPHIYDTGELDGEIIYKDDNGLSVLASTSINLDGKPHDLEPGHSYIIDLNGNGGDQINFQLGPVPDNGVNGLTNEALLAIVIHRTNILNNKFPCDENKRAITYMENALAAFEERTKNRKVRGVEGKNVV